MRSFFISIVTVLFFCTALSAAESQIKSIGWELSPVPADCNGLPGWVKNPSADASVKKFKSGLLFSIPEQGKEYRWQINFGKIDLHKYSFMRIRYRAEGVDQSKSGGYIIYSQTLEGQRLYPLVSSQLKVDSSLEGDLHEETINLNEKSKLKDKALIQKVVIGMKAATNNAKLYIESLEIFSDKEIDSAISYIKIPQGRAILPATTKYKDLTSCVPNEKLPVTQVAGWANDSVRGADLIAKIKDNILFNGNFENSKDGKLNGWSYELRDGAEGSVELDNSFAKNGKQSLKITKTNGKGYIVVFSEKAIPAKAGDKLTFQGFYHTQNIKSQQRTLGMVRLAQKKDDFRYNRSLDAWDASQTQQDMINAKDGQWQKRIGNVKLEKGLPEQIIAYVIIYGNPVTVWWDELTIEPFPVANARWVSKNPRNVDYWKSERITDKELTKTLNSDINHTAELKKINGKSALLVDGKVSVPVIYKGSPLSPMNFQGGELDKTGVKIQMQIINFGAHVLEDIPEQPGKLNRKNDSGMFTDKGTIDATKGIELLRQAMRTSPDSLFLLDLKVRPYPAFVTDNPAEAWLNEKGQKGYGTATHLEGFSDTLPADRVFWPSYFSVKWQDTMIAALDEFIVKLNESGLSKRVIGFQITAGHDDQFSYRYLDYSSHAVNAFRDYLRKKYGTDEALKNAWGKNVTFSTAATPVVLKETHRFLDPAENTDWYDYWRFIQHELLAVQERFARATKTAFGKKVLAMKYQQGTYMGTYVGIYNVEEFFNSDVFDITTPQPGPYGRRSPGINYCFNETYDSYHLHNKLLVGEYDFRTYFRTRYGEVKTGKMARAESFGMWQSLQRKLVGEMIANCQGYWYYDLHWGWFQKEIATDIGESTKINDAIYRKTLAEKDSKRTNLVVVLDEESLYWTAIGSRYYLLETDANTRNIWEIGNSGVPFDYIILEDLINHPELADKYKVFVFNHSYRLDAKRRVLYEKLKSKNNVLVWLYAAGFVGEKTRSVKTMKELTGISIGVSTNVIDKSVLKTNSSNPLAQGLLDKQDCVSIYKAWSDLTGTKEDFFNAPYFFVNDSQAQIIATYQQTGQGAIAVKKFTDWTSVYIATAGGLSAELLNNICRQAGAYVCTSPGLDISMNNNFISLHGIIPGFYTLNLPRKCNVRNLKDGKIIAENTDKIQMWAEAQSTYWLGLED